MNDLALLVDGLPLIFDDLTKVVALGQLFLKTLLE
jgi:hypothetical protein